MSTDRETTRMVRSWLEEGVTALPDRVLDGGSVASPASVGSAVGVGDGAGDPGAETRMMAGTTAMKAIATMTSAAALIASLLVAPPLPIVKPRHSERRCGVAGS